MDPNDFNDRCVVNDVASEDGELPEDHYEYDPEATAV